MKDFLWSLGQVQAELARFLLDERNILWYPDQIFQDLENNIFSFLYIPYYKGEDYFLKLLEYFVEHIDYEDEVLVECVYKMYEQCERNGEIYLQSQIFEDAKLLDREQTDNIQNSVITEKVESMQTSDVESEQSKAASSSLQEQILEQQEESDRTTRRGIRYFLDGRKRKSREERDNYRQNMQLAMEGCAVAEDTVYEDEEYGRTIYIEDVKNQKEIIRRLYTLDGRILIQLDNDSCTIGKKKKEVDLVLDDFTVSRLHARITKEREKIFLEDLNSTNGTYKNGLRMQPYEKLELEEGDEVKIGKVVLIFR